MGSRPRPGVAGRLRPVRKGLNVLVWILGIVLFALGICLSVALHEAGHMVTAKAFGMKVRRYFIGFGPRIWSFRRGETEYGVKAIPLGGFCDIAGMTALDPVTPAESERAMWRYPAWKRVVVMGAGSVTHFILGFILLYLLAATMGLPNLRFDPASVTPQVGTVADCVMDKTAPADAACQPGAPAPARDAGMRAGDVITAVNGAPTRTWTDVVRAVEGLSGPAVFTVDRGGTSVDLTVDVAQVQGVDGRQVGAVGMRPVLPPTHFQYDAVSAFGGAIGFTGDMLVRTWQGLLAFPEKIPKVVEAIGGGQRDPDTPVSVVGASILGGDAVERGLWDFVLLLLASLNFFVGLFNLLPLLPLDGGHIAVTLYEKVRDWVRKLRGLAPGGPVDYTKLTAVTMVVIFIGGAVVLLTVTADLVNPIRIGQ
jgi:membrane-associated protease RseP (regulator of RpoE activity)